MKKLLFVSSRPILPLHSGGQIRTYQMLEMLSETFEINIVFLNDKTTTEDNLKGLNRFANKIKYFKLSKYKSYFQVLYHSVLNRLPLQVNYYYSSKLQKWVKQNIEEYDVVFCNNIRTAEYFRNFGLIKVIDYVDAISMNYKKAKNTSSGIWKILHAIDYKRLLSYEVELMNCFNRKIIISEVDKQFIIKKSSNKDLEVVKNYVSGNNDSFNSVVDRITFLGKMDYEPNISAVKFFVNKVLPLVHKDYGFIEFHIVGINPTNEIKGLEKFKGVKVVGFVDDSDDYLGKSLLIVAPMVSGAGIQNKILQAMSLGKCVVTTTTGAEGLNEVNSNELLIFDSPNDLANNISIVLKNDSLRNEIGSNARDYVINKFSKRQIQKGLIKYLNYEE